MAIDAFSVLLHSFRLCSAARDVCCRSVFRLLCLFSLVTVPVMAQFDSGIRGVVSDPAGAIVAGAAVTLRNVNTGIETKMVTDNSGSYDLRSLAPGEYMLRVQAPGFGAFSQGQPC